MLRGAAKGYALGFREAYVQFDILARMGGALLNLNSALIILVASKTLMTYLRRTRLNMIVPFDKAMPAFHIIIGNMLVVGTVLHVVFQTCNYAAFKLWYNNPSDRVGLAHYRSLLITGVILLVIIVAMRITSLSVVRRKKFEVFWSVHTTGFVLYFVVLVLHGMHNKEPMTWRYVVAPCAIYFLDRCVRYHHEKGSRLLVPRSALQQKGEDMVCVRLPRTFSYLAGQYCELKLPAVSKFEWHPFTIASSPHESEMLFFIKNTGDWTSKLYELADHKSGASDDDDNVVVLVRGPYGAPAQHVGQYEHVVLISGGVGATPFASITKYAHHWILNYTQRGMQTGTSVSAAFTRNQSTRNNSVPGTPTLAKQNANQSSDVSRTLSWRASGNFQRGYSRSGISRSVSSRGSRPGSRTGSRPGSRALSRSNSGSVIHGTDTGTSVGSIGRIILEQRQNQPFGPAADRADERALPRYFDTDNSGSELRGRASLPDDYDVELGNPDAPIPDRYPGASHEALLPSGKHMLEAVREYDSSKALFDDDDDVEAEAAELEARRQRESESIGFDEGVPYGELDLEIGGIQLEDEILREQQTASNAYNMLGMSFGSAAILRHLQMNRNAQIRSSLMRASMNVMDEALDKAPIAERLLFYLHSVTVNWLLLWIMILRFAMVAVGEIVGRLLLQDRPLHFYNSITFAIVDLVLAVFILLPVLLAMLTEMRLRGLGAFCTDEVGNVFDLVFLVPLLMVSVALTCYISFVPNDLPHMFEVTVFGLWPLTTLLLLWRTGRTIGSRISLAQYFKSTHSQTKSLDFLWVSKAHADDQWLISELLPLAGSGIVRLHRFITREPETTEPWMLDFEKVPLKTTYKRPDWDDVFSALVERTRSGSVVGVFFCGPDPMARAVQQSAMKAMTASVDNALQRGFMAKRMYGASSAMNVATEDDMTPGRFTRSRSTPATGVLSRMSSKVGTLARTLSSRKATAPRPDNDYQDKAAYGCNVRISVRIENFN